MEAKAQRGMGICPVSQKGEDPAVPLSCTVNYRAGVEPSCAEPEARTTLKRLPPEHKPADTSQAQR